MGTKAQRQNQHARRLSSKIKRHNTRGWDTTKLEKELGYCTGDKRPVFKTGRDVDPRLKKRHSH